ncbi:MAG: response regulator [Candidatus Thorarchaeota archaeon]|nr:response regulator [Candidatus Thorarchaeota archaeon]
MARRKPVVILAAAILILLGTLLGFFPFLRQTFDLLPFPPLLDIGPAEWYLQLAVAFLAYSLSAVLVARGIQEAPIRPTEKKSRRKTRVVAIDDEEDILRLIRIKLSREGFRVITAQNGAQGIDTVLDKHPDVMLVDVMMPKKNGYEVVSEIKKKMGKNAPVAIMLTSKSEEQDMMEGLTAGADDYITKPFSPTELIERINVSLLKERRAAQAESVEQT